MNFIFRRCLSLGHHALVSSFPKSSVSSIQARCRLAWQVGHHSLTKARGFHLQAALLTNQQSSQPVEDAVSTSLFTQHPHLNRPGAHSLHKLLVSYHFTDQDFLEIAKMYPQLMENNSWQMVYRVLMILSSLKLTNDHILELVRVTPHILLLTEKEVLARVDELYQYFNRKSLRHLLQHTPEAFFLDRDEMKKIVHFVLFIMLLPMNELLVSKALNYDFAHLKTRYEYLVRTGVYKENSEKIKHMKNPSLTTIIRTPEEEFAKIPDNMTVEDFRIFARLLEREKDPFLEALFEENLEKKDLDEEDEDEEEEEEEVNDRIL